MKHALPFLIFVFFPVFCFSQEKLVFSYDSAGNQILREGICVGCAQKSTASKKQIGSVQANKTDPFLNNEGVGFVAYPNPVTNILQTHWFNTETKYIVRMSLFSFKSKLLFRKALQRKVESLKIDFSGFQSGVYILKFLYNTGEKEFYKVIKK